MREIALAVAAAFLAGAAIATVVTPDPVSRTYPVTADIGPDDDNVSLGLVAEDDIDFGTVPANPGVSVERTVTLPGTGDRTERIDLRIDGNISPYVSLDRTTARVSRDAPANVTLTFTPAENLSAGDHLAGGLTVTWR